MWNEGFAPALALVDKPEVLSSLRTAFPQDADRYAAINRPRARNIGLCGRHYKASVSAAAAYRTKS
jgi:hypothetical protein